MKPTSCIQHDEVLAEAIIPSNVFLGFYAIELDIIVDQLGFINTVGKIPYKFSGYLAITP
jgi:hypothetical protein